MILKLKSKRKELGRKERLFQRVRASNTM